MNISYFIYIILITSVFAIVIKKRKRSLSKNLLNRFIKDFKSSNKYYQRINERYNIQLLSDPKTNLKINAWEKEFELVEKMKIHRTRLSKFGSSKMNGKTYHQESNGEVFTISKDGKKIYV